MRFFLSTAFIAMALSNISCAMFVHTDGKDCFSAGYYSGESSAPAEPRPTGGSKEEHTAAFNAWAQKMNDRYITLKNQAFADAQQKALHLGITHISYQDPDVTLQKDNTLKAKVAVFGFKCPSSTSFPKGTVPATDPVRPQSAPKFME